MLVVYSVDISTLKIDIHGIYPLNSLESKNPHEAVDSAARSFICRYQGEIRSKDPYRDDIPDNKIVDDGCFLRHSNDLPSRIDVYSRKVVPGTMWYSVDCKKIVSFDYSWFGSPPQMETDISETVTEELSKNIPVGSKNTSVVSQSHENTGYMVELKQRLDIIRAELDRQ